ncbi:glutathione S-transferase family protein [Halomonas sp. HNIBRBA4712]|uniref:glutathione S-transferase family protein n=1 Tax=Halomonas sp. HNIBRBA4712 TaxID=3373087 RepID=UPI00374582CD
MALTLYAHRLSQPCRAVEILARELGIDYDFHEVDFAGGETHTEWFAQINPLETVPALKVTPATSDTFSLGESQAIMIYFCRTADNRDTAQRWYPNDADTLTSARIDQWLAWHHANVRRFDMFHHIMNLHLTLPMLKREIQSTLLKPLQDGLAPGLATLEVQLERSNTSRAAPTLLGGEHPTLADLAIACELYQIRAVGYTFGRYPHVQTWLDALAEREHFKAVCGDIDAQGREVFEQSGAYLALGAFG